MAGSICDCCFREEKEVVGVFSSSLGAVSWAFCQECLDKIAEPECMFDYMHDFVSDNLGGLAEWCQQFTTFKDGRYWTIQEWYEWRLTQPPSKAFEEYMQMLEDNDKKYGVDDIWPEPVEDFTPIENEAISNYLKGV